MPAGFIAIGGLVGVGGAGFGAMVAGIAVSAVVGAAIGGLSAAVMGGDIGKGMLFGAVGGVVTGGIAGQGIAGMFQSSSTYLSGSSGSMFNASSGITSLGEGGGVIGASTSQTAAATANVGSAAAGAGSGGGSGLFGGALNSKFMSGAAGPLLSAAGQAFNEPDQDPRLTDAWREDEQAHAREMAKLNASLSGGGGGGGGSDVPYMELERLKQEGALNQIAAEAAEQRAALGITGAQKLAQQGQEYKLANQNAQAEWDRGMEKLSDAANVAADQTYQSGEGAYEEVLAAQKAGGDVAMDRNAGALAGPIVQEEVA